MTMANQLLDAKGLNCPLPILKAKKALKDVPAGGTLEVLATDPGSVADFAAFCRTTGNELVEFDAGKRHLPIPDQAGELNEGKSIRNKADDGARFGHEGARRHRGDGLRQSSQDSQNTPVEGGNQRGKRCNGGSNNEDSNSPVRRRLGCWRWHHFRPEKLRRPRATSNTAGARARAALGGAGVADSRDAMSLSLNPAGLVDVDNQFQVGASLFVPFRGYTATTTGFIAPGAFGSGTIDSSNNYFVVPNLAYSSPIDADSAWGVAMFGNGGMNTTYRKCNQSCLRRLAGTGVFCGGNSGVDMMQAFLTAGYARRMGALSFGVAPIIAIQRLKMDGLAALSRLIPPIRRT